MSGGRVVHHLARRGRAARALVGAVVPTRSRRRSVDGRRRARAIDELDDVEPVLGGVVDDLKTTTTATASPRAVVDDASCLDSRWQPETPSAMPVQSNVTRAALLIVISKSG
jgi:hypothetical protein